jgi:hypothetical protein
MSSRLWERKTLQAKYTREIQTNTFSVMRKIKSIRFLAIRTGSRIQFVRSHPANEDRAISAMTCRWGSLRIPMLRSRKRPASCLYQAMGFTPQSCDRRDGNSVMRLTSGPSRRPGPGGSRIAVDKLDWFSTVNYNIWLRRTWWNTNERKVKDGGLDLPWAVEDLGWRLKIWGGDGGWRVGGEEEKVGNSIL